MVRTRQRDHFVTVYPSDRQVWSIRQLLVLSQLEMAAGRLHTALVVILTFAGRVYTVFE